MRPPRRRALQQLGLAATGSLAAPLLGLGPDLAQAAGGPRAIEPHVLRYAFLVAETSFDPHAVSDLYSRMVVVNIFDALFEYDHLARPHKLVPALAAALPEVSADFRTWTLRIRPGVMFQDDAAFSASGGKGRECTAEDVAFSFKRIYDPATRSPSISTWEENGLAGLSELRAASLAQKKPFDYAAPVAGLQVLDRHTLRIQLKDGRPRLLDDVANLSIMAPEVVRHYGEHIGEHPVGTGPFRLKSWRRSSRIVLERNPTYRERYYDAQPAEGDVEGQALLARYKGRRLPMLDRVEIAIIEEAQPRWLAFLNHEHDLLYQLPPDYVAQALPGGALAPHLKRAGVKASRIAASDVNYIVFNTEHPLVGGLDKPKVALRRAIGLAYEVDREIRIARRGEAVPAHGLTVPGTFGYEEGLVSEATRFDRARAKAMLDEFGYLDRNGDGWRETPEGQPLVLEVLSQSDQASRALDEVFKASMDAVGLKVEMRVGQWSENLKNTRAGRFMVWRVGSSANTPDGQGAIERAYGGSIGKGNLARFRLPAFDAIFRRIQALPDGPERQALFREANKLALAYMPYRCTVHRMLTDLMRPQLQGYRRPLFWYNWWHMVDVVDPERTA